MNTPRKGTDFGDWDWNFNPMNWINYGMPLLNNNGSIIIFAHINLFQIFVKIEELNGVVKDIIVWQKPTQCQEIFNDVMFKIWNLLYGLLRIKIQSGFLIKIMIRHIKEALSKLQRY